MELLQIHELAMYQDDGFNILYWRFAVFLAPTLILSLLVTGIYFLIKKHTVKAIISIASSFIILIFSFEMLHFTFSLFDPDIYSFNQHQKVFDLMFLLFVAPLLLVGLGAYAILSLKKKKKIQCFISIFLALAVLAKMLDT